MFDSRKPAVLIFVFLCFHSAAFCVQSSNGSLIDSTHQMVSMGLNRPVQWIDSFFGNENYLEEARPHTLLLLKNAFTFREGGSYVSQFKYSADVDLPKASRRLKLTVFGARRNHLEEKLPEDDIEPDLIEKDKQQSLYLGARYFLLDLVRTKINFGGGFKFGLPPQGYARAKFLQEFPLLLSFNGRFAYTVLWRDTEGKRYSPKLEFDRFVFRNVLLRWSNLATRGDGINGTNWESDIYLFVVTGRNAAVSLSSKLYGVSKPAVNTTLARVGLGYRRSIFKEWFFYEIMPEIQWPKDSLGRRKALPAAVLSLEARFEAGNF